MVEIIMSCILILLMANFFILEFIKYKKKLAWKWAELIYFGNIESLDMFLLRMVATFISMFHIGLEISSNYDGLCTPYIRISDNLQHFSSFLVRIYYLQRAGICYVITSQIKSPVSYKILIPLIFLYLKTLILMNVLGKDDSATCDFVYPNGLLYYMASESLVYDIIITVVTIWPLYKYGYGKNEEVVGIMRIIVGINITTILIYILLVSVAETVGYYDETPILMVLNNYWYVISTWIPFVFTTVIDFRNSSVFFFKATGKEEAEEYVEKATETDMEKATETDMELK